MASGKARSTWKKVRGEKAWGESRGKHHGRLRKKKKKKKKKIDVKD